MIEIVGPIMGAFASAKAARAARDAAMRQAGIFNHIVKAPQPDAYPLQPPRSPTYWDAFKPLALPLFYACGIVGIGALIVAAVWLALP